MQQLSPQPDKKYFGVLSDAVLIALVTLVGYGVAFSFEAGYLGAFKIPNDYIEIDITKSLFAISILIGLLTVGLVVLHIFSGFGLLDFSKPFRRRIALAIALLTYLLLYVILFPNNWREWLGAGTLLISWIVIDIIRPIIAYRSAGSLDNRIAADFKAKDITEKRELIWQLRDMSLSKFGTTLTFVILLSPIGLSLSYSAGKSIASSRTEHVVLCDERDWAFVRSYDEKGLFVQFDETKLLTGRFRVRKISSENALCFETIKTGKLRPTTSDISKNSDRKSLWMKFKL